MSLTTLEHIYGPQGLPVRLRRLRHHGRMRHALAETNLEPAHLLAPLFVTEGTNVRHAISSMPGQYVYSLDQALEKAQHWHRLGIAGILLFVKISASKKENTGKEALNERGLMPQAIHAIKQRLPDMPLFTDIALDPYSSHGHDGIVRAGRVLNDETVKILAQMAVLHAQAGADFVAPSDMMDGRVGAIRRRLDMAGHTDTGIMSYSAKYASSLYGPFRDALESAPAFGDKKTYQLNPANVQEAIREALLDEQEGADILMVKPGLPYLDVLMRLGQHSQLPLAAYQVSGEYAMLHSWVPCGWRMPYSKP